MPGETIGRKEYPGGGLFEAAIHDLLAEPSDAIVNAANGFLAHGGGVAAAILAAAGPELEREGQHIVRERGRIPVGGAVLTGAGRLPFQAVIHAVGPRQGEGHEEDKLVEALLSAFGLAWERGFTSLSFPAISSGIYAVPAATCARAYLRAADEFYARHPGSCLKTLRLALLPGPVVEAVRALLRQAP